MLLRIALRTDRSENILVEGDYREVINRCWQLRREKRFAEAELLLHDALDNFPANSFAHRVVKANLAEVLLQRQNRTEAREMALEILAEDPDQAVALSVLGMVALEEKQYSEAAENLQKAYSLVPSGYRAGRLARAYELDGKTEKALAILNEALHRNPRDGYLLRQYNNLRVKAGNISNVAHKEDPPVLSASGKIDEEDYLPYAEQIKIKLQKLEPAEAAEELKKLIRVGDRGENPHLHLLLGNLLREAGNEEAAMEAYRQARELDPRNILALSQFLYSLRRLGRREEAWPLLKLLLFHHPGDVTAKSSLIKDAVDLGKEKETLLFFEELIQKYPERKELYGTIRKLQNAAAGKGGDI